MRPLPLSNLDTANAVAGDGVVFDSANNVYVPGLVIQAIIAGTGVTVDSANLAAPVVAAAQLEPLTTEANGVPDLVWDDDNQLVMTTAV